MSPQDEQKRSAALAAVRLVRDGMTLGLGTGSTAAWFVRLLGERVRTEGLRVRGVATSEATAALARSLGIEVVCLEDAPEIDLCVDGVDEVDGERRAIKGGGGALLREKIVAAASTRVVSIADASKRVQTLGAFPLPVEVVPFAVAFVQRRIAALGCSAVVRRDAGGEAFRTDSGNIILDCPFGRIDDPESLAAELALIPGIVEHGLFLGLIDEVIVPTGDEGPT